MSSKSEWRQPKPWEDKTAPWSRYIQIHASFTYTEVRQLKEARERCMRGELNEWPEVYKYLRFARWLFKHGMLEG